MKSDLLVRPRPLGTTLYWYDFVLYDFVLYITFFGQLCSSYKVLLVPIKVLVVRCTSKSRTFQKCSFQKWTYLALWAYLELVRLRLNWTGCMVHRVPRSDSYLICILPGRNRTHYDSIHPRTWGSTSQYDHVLWKSPIMRGMCWNSFSVVATCCRLNVCDLHTVTDNRLNKSIKAFLRSSIQIIDANYICPRQQRFIFAYFIILRGNMMDRIWIHHLSSLELFKQDFAINKLRLQLTSVLEQDSNSSNKSTVNHNTVTRIWQTVRYARLSWNRANKLFWSKILGSQDSVKLAKKWHTLCTENSLIWKSHLYYYQISLIMLPLSHDIPTS